MSHPVHVGGLRGIEAHGLHELSVVNDAVENLFDGVFRPRIEDILVPVVVLAGFPPVLWKHMAHQKVE